MRVSIKKCGNSGSVQIPVEIIQAAHLELNQVLDVRADNGRIIIEPVQQLGFDLGSLIAGITRENLHEEVDFGVPVSKEAW